MTRPGSKGPGRLLLAQGSSTIVQTLSHVNDFLSFWNALLAVALYILGTTLSSFGYAMINEAIDAWEHFAGWGLRIAGVCAMAYALTVVVNHI